MFAPAKAAHLRAVMVTATANDSNKFFQISNLPMAS